VSPISTRRVPATGESTGSVSSTGIPIAIADTSDPGTTIDAGDTSDVQGDEGFTTTPPTYRRWLWATNNDTSARDFNLQWGGSGASYRHTVSLAAKSGPVLIVDGWLLARTLAVSGWSDSANKVNVAYLKEPV
jgi:hypothetical protein